MKAQEARGIARGRGLQPGKAEKAELIMTIQRQQATSTVSPRRRPASATSPAACGARIVLPRPGMSGIPETAVFNRIEEGPCF